MPINPIPQPVDVIINPSGEPPKIKDFIINAPLIVQSTNVKNKLDSLDSTSENLSQRVTVLENRPIATASGPSGDYVPTSRTINSHALTADITITKSDLGLANVDNTSDINKPVSTAQAAADAAVLVSANAYTDAHTHGGGGGGAATTMGHSWERPDPVVAGIGAVFINTDDGGEYVSSGTAPTNGVPLSGWMRRLPSGMATTRAAIISTDVQDPVYPYASIVGTRFINTNKIPLQPFTTNNCSFALHYYWNGTPALVPYYIDTMLTYGANNDFADGAAAFYYQAGGTGPIYITLYANGAGTFLGAPTPLAIPAVAGYNTLVFAPVSYGGNHYWRWSYNGSAAVDTPMTNPYVTPGTFYNYFTVWGRSDNVVLFGGKGIDVAAWTTLLSNADMAILSNPPAGTYGLLETASTGPATIRIEANRFDSANGVAHNNGNPLQAMPIRGGNRPADVWNYNKKVNLP